MGAQKNHRIETTQHMYRLIKKVIDNDSLLFEAMIVHKSNQALKVESFNSYLASSDFCRLLIAFANSLDPDQDRQNVSPDLDPN